MFSTLSNKLDNDASMLLSLDLKTIESKEPRASRKANS